MQLGAYNAEGKLVVAQLPVPPGAAIDSSTSDVVPGDSPTDNIEDEGGDAEQITAEETPPEDEAETKAQKKAREKREKSEMQAAAKAAKAEAKAEAAAAKKAAKAVKSSSSNQDGQGGSSFTDRSLPYSEAGVTGEGDGAEPCAVGTEDLFAGAGFGFQGGGDA